MAKKTETPPPRSNKKKPARSRKPDQGLGRVAAANQGIPSRKELQLELETVRTRLAEAEDTLNAIRNGEVDAVLVSQLGGHSVFTLKGAEHIYRLLIEEMNEGAGTLSADGTILYCNNALISMLGRPMDRIMGTSFRNYLTTSSIPSFSEFIKKSLSGSGRTEVNLRTPKGQIFPVRLSGKKLSPDRDLYWISLVVSDMTAQKETEKLLRRRRDELEVKVANRTEELRNHQLELQAQNEGLRAVQEELEASRQKYAELYEDAPVGYLTIDSHGLIRDINSSGVKMFEVEKSLLVNKPFSLFLDGAADRDLFSAHRNEVLHKQVRGTCDVRVKRANGSVFHAELQSVAVENPFGKVGLIRTAVTDITMRKWAEEALRASEARYRSLIELSPDAIVVHAEGKFVYCNPAALNLYGAGDAGKIIGRDVLDTIHPGDSDAIKRRMHETYGNKVKSLLRQTKILRLDGRSVEVESIAAPITYQGRPAVQVVIRDITERNNAARALRQSEAEFRTMFEVSNVGKAQADCNTRRFLRVNQALCDITGYTKQELLSLTMDELNHPDDRERDSRLFRDMVNRSSSYDIEKRYIRKDRSIIWVRVSGNVIRDSQGRPLRTAAVIQDITQQRAAEQALRQSEGRLKNILNSITDAFIALDADWRFLEINAVAERDVFRRPASELLGKIFWDLYPKGRGGVFHQHYERAFREQKPVHFEAPSNVNGKWVEVHAYPETNRLDIYFRDITERKHAEVLLRKANDELEKRVHERTEDLERTVQTLLEEISERKKTEEDLIESKINLAKAQSIAHIGSWSFDLVSKKLVFSEELCRIFELEPGSHIDLERMILQVVHPEDWEKVRAAYRQLQTMKKAESFEYRIVLPDGGQRTVWAEVETIAEDSGEPLSIIGIVQDITERKRSEEELIRLATAVQSAADALVVTEPERGIIQYVNPAFEKITGYSRDEALGRDLHLLDSGRYDQAFYDKVRETIRKKGYWNGRILQKKKDGSLYEEECTHSPVRNASGKVINYISIKRDVTEKVRLESIAQAVETMNNIGYIFSGVSHEIGNPVSILGMTLKLMSKNIDRLPKERLLEYTGHLTTQVSRIEYLLKNLKNFNMYEQIQPQQADVSSFLEGFLSLIRKDFEATGITIDAKVDPTSISLYTDPRALQQVLLNIFTNAADAMKGREHPKIIMSVTRVSDRVTIGIQDNGSGMDEATLRNLFKPFYTNKPKGTGLGLVIIKKMIARMNGTIAVRSRLNEGTTVELSLPAHGR